MASRRRCPDRSKPRTARDARSCSRRRTLACAATVGVGLVAGCTGRLGLGDDGDDGDDRSGLPDLPRVEDPPDAVYVPTHREAMVHLPTVTAGDYAVSPMLTQPHRFWLVTGQEVRMEEPESPGVHLMVTVWDEESGAVIPVDTVMDMTVRRDGKIVDERVPWPMISQTMGFHFGDNVPLGEDGEYTVEITLQPVSIRKTGSFSDRFETGDTATFEFIYDEEFRREVVDGIEYLDEEFWGERGALEPGMQEDESHDMDGDDHEGDAGDHDADDGDHGNHGDHHMPFPSLPSAEEYPGESLGEPTSGDARFVVRYLADSPLAEDGYLVVSPRTPYNRVPLPDMALSVEGAVNASLTQTLDGELGLHYGTAADLAPGDEFDLVVEGPPQVARHAGYETAFLEMPPMAIEVS